MTFIKSLIHLKSLINFIYHKMLTNGVLFKKIAHVCDKLKKLTKKLT
jgi:hypothetical protein